MHIGDVCTIAFMAGLGERTGDGLPGGLPATFAVVLVVLVTVVAGTCAGRIAILSRELWQPEPLQSCPAWWFGPSRTHSFLPALVFHFMPYSWQLMHFMEVT